MKERWSSMNQTRPDNVSLPGLDLDLELQKCLGQFSRGECTDIEFVDQVSRLLRAPADAGAADHSLLALNQQFMRGEISADTFRSRASTIIGRASDTYRVGATIDLQMTDAASSSMPVGVGRVLRDRYVLEKCLGSGGMGTVFKALDRYRADLPQANQYVAIKILHDKTEDRLELLANLRREFYCTQRLSHRNIVKVYELDRDGDVDFFTMELLEGEPLSSVTERLHPLPMPRSFAWTIIREIGSGLAHAHAAHDT